MKYLDVNEVLCIIDEKFNYSFEGKEEKDHLISSKTWNRYVAKFQNDNQESKKFVSDLKYKITGSGRYTKYREDFVKDVINCYSHLLEKQFNSNRKTMPDIETIERFKAFSEGLNLKLDKNILDKRIPITQHKKRQNMDFLIVTEEQLELGRKCLLKIAINQLIDMDKINEDAREGILGTSIIHGLAEPLNMIEDEDGRPLGFEIDAKNYLKKSIIDEIINQD